MDARANSEPEKTVVARPRRVSSGLSQRRSLPREAKVERAAVTIEHVASVAMLDHLSRVGPGEQRGDRRAPGRASLVADVLLVDVLHAELLVELDFDDPPVRPHHVDFDRPVALELDTAHLARASFGARRGDRSLAKGAGYLIMGERLAATKLFIKLTQLERGPEGHLDEGTVRSTYIDLPAVAIASGRIGQLGPGPVQRHPPRRCGIGLVLFRGPEGHEDQYCERYRDNSHREHLGCHCISIIGND
jgi:hypothetical protein